MQFTRYKAVRLGYSCTGVYSRYDSSLLKMLGFAAKFFDALKAVSINKLKPMQ
jgi:hypothetical protein